MNTDQARRLITLHDNADRALANLRNAGAMSTDDPRAAEMLESAGDAYVEAKARLYRAEDECIPDAYAKLEDPADAPSAPETPSEDSEQGQAAEDPQTGADAAS